MSTSRERRLGSLHVIDLFAYTIAPIVCYLGFLRTSYATSTTQFPPSVEQNSDFLLLHSRRMSTDAESYFCTVPSLLIETQPSFLYEFVKPILGHSHVIPTLFERMEKTQVGLFPISKYIDMTRKRRRWKRWKRRSKDEKAGSPERKKKRSC